MERICKFVKPSLLSKVIMLIIILIVNIIPNALAQKTHNVEVTELYNKKVDYNFNEEWQYLTTDFYIMNMDKIGTLLDAVLSGEKRSKKIVKSVFISAELQGTILNDISYPLYNFISNENDGEIQTDSRDKVRIMNNYPVSSVSQSVSAVIKMEIITKDKENAVFEFVSKQLKNISGYSTPLSAAKTLTGELSNLMESRIKNTKYEFSSTIDIYKEDFDKKLFSVGVYMFQPEGNNEKPNITNFVNDFDSEDINKNNIPNFISGINYPYLVSVNYKSKYVSPLNITSEITDESVLQRKIDIKAKYDGKELNQKLYSQEQTLNQFLEEYVRLQKAEKNYSDNKNRTNQEGKNQMLLDLIDSYKTFYNLYCQRIIENEDDDIFKDIFKHHYDDVLKLADKNMARNSELKNIMLIVKCSERYEENFQQSFDNNDIEQDLAILHSVRLPHESDYETKINSLISKIEELYYNRDLLPLMSKLGSANNQQILAELKNKRAVTYCESCKPKLTNAIAQYDSQIAEEQKADAIVKMQNLKTQSRSVLLTSQNLTEDIGNLQQYSSDVFKNNVEDLKKQQQQLQDLVNKDYSNANTTTIEDGIKIIENAKFDVESQTSQIKNQFEEIKKNNPATQTYNYTPTNKPKTETQTTTTEPTQYTFTPSNDFENSRIKFNEAVSEWQNYSQKVKEKIWKLQNFMSTNDVEFSGEEETQYNSLIKELQRLDNISKENISSLTPYQLSQKTDDLKTASKELVRKTDKFYNDFMEGF